MGRAWKVVCVLAGLLPVACPGTATRPPGWKDAAGLDRGWRPPDLSAAPDRLVVEATMAVPDLGGPADQGGCSPEDALTACDPIAPSGCPVGAGCYIVSGTNVDCVCPAGTVPAGGACTTTTACLPGHGCVGDTPPGVCRRVCDPVAPTTCGAGLVCKKVANLPQYGMCVP